MTNSKTAPVNKNTKSHTNNYPKKSSNVYENMAVLRRDLYYKEIVNAHAVRITAETNKTINDILYRFGKNYISKRDLFLELEALRSGFPCTDVPVKEAIRAIRAKK